MNENHRDLISIGFTVAVVLLTLFVVHNFIVPIIWAGILALATWPVKEWLASKITTNDTVLASILTVVISLVVAIPLFWLTVIAVQEAKLLTAFLLEANRHGIAAPDWLAALPKGEYLVQRWNELIGTPKGVSHLLVNGHISIKTFSDFIKIVGLQLAHRSVTFGFALVALFFFYRDGERLAKQIDALGHYCLQSRWTLYAHQLPGAITATVNGVILVGIAVGVIMGVVYGILGVPLAAMFGALTAIFAMIPFGAPVIFVICAFILLVKSQFIAAFVLGSVGTLVMLIADHFIRPVLIGGATRLHFLAVLFGILGGVETLGLVGLFIGPVIMVLFTTLWREPELSRYEHT